MLPVRNVFDLICKDLKLLGQVHAWEKYNMKREELVEIQNEAKERKIHADRQLVNKKTRRESYKGNTKEEHFIVYYSG